MDSLQVVLAPWPADFPQPSEESPRTFGHTFDGNVYPPVVVTLSPEVLAALGDTGALRVTVEAVTLPKKAREQAREEQIAALEEQRKALNAQLRELRA